MAMIIAMAVVSGIWMLGSCNLWRLQNKSRNIVRIGWRDRLFALLWLPASLYLLAISLPYLTWDLIRRKRRGRTWRRSAQGAKRASLRLVKSSARVEGQDRQSGLPHPPYGGSPLQVVKSRAAPDDALFTIRSPAGRRR
ncbi:hypothetical protein [Sphingobium sp. SA916]|uniref:hypothetical protein n=1 Tax=Sphingobium sp. SA916 TaxID=1851207 RepID=UPI0011AFD264|nr:hypothetical protein [Sphingobium sp. SA916]